MNRGSGCLGEMLFILALILGLLWALIFALAVDVKHCVEIFYAIIFGVPALIGVIYLAVQAHKDTKETKDQMKKCTPPDQPKWERKTEQRQDVTARLDQLSELYRSGIITESEYRKTRQRILDEL